VDAGFDPQAASSMQARLQRHDGRFNFRSITVEQTVWQGFRPPVPPGFPHSRDRLMKPSLWLAALDQLNDWDRVLCLDGDLLVTTDLNDIFSIDMGGRAAAACQDASHLLAHDCPDLEIARQHGGQPYHNSGLVLVDLQQWRRDSLFNAALEFMKQWSEQIKQEDQTVFNSVLAGRIQTLPRQFNISHEALGLLETPAPERLPWRGYIWHLWRQYKPWLGFNYMESGALWYGLHEAWHGRQQPRYHTTRPGYRQMTMRMRHPRLTSLYHRLRGHREMASFWVERARAGTGKGNWAKRFEARIDEAAAWWEDRLGEVRSEKSRNAMGA